MKKFILAKISVLFFFTGAFCQDTLFLENFDAATVNSLPTNWTGTAAGFTVENSNFSTGYAGATGLQNIVIRNTVASGIYYLETPSFSTINMDNITLSYGVRHTTNFPIPGSTADVLEYTIDNGTEWNSVTFVQNPSNSVWALINGGQNIQLPAEVNNKPIVKLRWGANIVNNLDGSYRIDDVLVKGNDFTTNLVSIDNKSLSIYPNPFENFIKVEGMENTLKMDITLRNNLGAIVFQEIGVQNNTLFFFPENLAKGIYFITVNSKTESYTKKIIK
jgi:hypothetical protein